jgi:2-oxoisovalerate dehydrogenase E2 component (dihydrolipoyl transacylase)
LFGGQFVKKKYVTMSFGCDHRVLNGADISNFSNQWKNYLENPDLAMTKMK